MKSDANFKNTRRRRQYPCSLVVVIGFLLGISDAFMLKHNRLAPPAPSLFKQEKQSLRFPSSSQLNAVDFAFFSNYIGPAPPATLESGVLSNYAPAATSLFNNMKLPAAVVTAGMISLGFATTFPELPKDGNFTKEIRDRCESLRRLHIVVALISVTSELIVVLWAAVEVNQLTERPISPAASVWDLIQRDCDLAWSAVNSHFVLGIIGFCAMLAIRAYVMLLAAQASKNLISAAMSGTAAALCLMISIVNRGVESGGGEGVGYGSTILDLLSHYASLLWAMATDEKNPGPLEMAAIGLEIASVGFVLQVLLSGRDKSEFDKMNEEESLLRTVPEIKETIILDRLDEVEPFSSSSESPPTAALLSRSDPLDAAITDVIIQKNNDAHHQNVIDSMMPLKTTQYDLKDNVAEKISDPSSTGSKMPSDLE